MEKQGIGIMLIISSCLEAGLSEPQFFELEHHVKLVIFRRSAAYHAETPPDPYDIISMKRRFSALGLFSSKDLAQYLGKSVSMAKKLLFELHQQGIVEKVGKGPATKYRFIK